MAEIDMPCLVAANPAQTRDIIAPAPGNFPTVWSLTPSHDGYNTELVPVIERLEREGRLRLPNRKVAPIAADNPWSRTIWEGLKGAFGAAGREITAEDMLPFGEINDWRAFLARVRQDPPAVLVNTDHQPGNAATFMTQFMEQPTNSLVFIQYAPSVPEAARDRQGARRDRRADRDRRRAVRPRHPSRAALGRVHPDPVLPDPRGRGILFPPEADRTGEFRMPPWMS